MAKKIIIDASHGGSDIGNEKNGIIEKNFVLDMSKYISSRLNELGITNSLVRNDDSTLDDEERVNKIKSLYGTGNDVIVISNHLNADNGIEIIYALRNNSKLAQLISNSFEDNGQIVNKYYQRRLPSDPIKDYSYLIRETPNNETLIIEYDYIDNYKLLGESVVKALANYVGVSYVPNKNLLGNYYTVLKGDSLYSIARKFNTTINALKELNNLSSNLLSIGQILEIPSTSVMEKTYTVVKGDSLYSIARKFNTTVDTLKKLNNLSSNLLSIGQILEIPSTSVMEKTYTVVKGDSLYSIARKFNTTVNILKELNNLSSNLLSIGQVLKIPNN